MGWGHRHYIVYGHISRKLSGIVSFFFQPGKSAEGNIPHTQEYHYFRAMYWIVAQFSISIVLITATIIVYLQIQYVKNRSLGYVADNLVMVPATGDISKNYTTIRQELLTSGMVNAVTRTSSPITAVWWKSDAPDWNGKPAGMSLIISGLNADKDFSKTMGIKILDGKRFFRVCLPTRLPFCLTKLLWKL